MQAWILGSLIFLSTQVFAQAQTALPVTPRLGQEYVQLEKPQPVDAGQSVEVTEFFAYFCHHCNDFEPYLEAWAKKQGKRIHLKRVHVNFYDLVTQQKLFYSLEAMGLVDTMQSKVFEAVHLHHNRLSTDAEVMKLVEKEKIDQKKFLKEYQSFTVSTKLARTAQLMSDYKIDGVPTIAIEGRYLVSPSDLFAKAHNPPGGKVHAGIDVMDFLVDKIYREKNLTMNKAAVSSASEKKAKRTKPLATDH